MSHKECRDLMSVEYSNSSFIMEEITSSIQKLSSMKNMMEQLLQEELTCNYSQRLMAWNSNCSQQGLSVLDLVTKHLHLHKNMMVLSWTSGGLRTLELDRRCGNSNSSFIMQVERHQDVLHLLNL